MPNARPRTPVSSDGERLLRRFARTRDRATRDRIVVRYLPMARFAACQFASGPEPFDDLFQVAAVGLLKAIDRYDPANGAAFSSYALPTMSGELRRHFRDRGWAVRPPRGLQERALRVERMAQQLQADGRGAVTVDDIARALACSPPTSGRRTRPSTLGTPTHCRPTTTRRSQATPLTGLTARSMTASDTSRTRPPWRRSQPRRSRAVNETSCDSASTTTSLSTTSPG
ncbi:sigma-70 family RNA polymerase sigma factor [Baekduia soli]|uniref:Sigma-70 family RNA polymerase sigma factor n=1 Tax=Baekduia soli TaxID=496014 RepID=A0A5B8UDY8_9ACTN|nr:sigma-70 family RNA polymerase sigma factor [Baekduia soli]